MAQWVVTLLCNHKNWSLYPQDTHKKLVVFMQCVCNLGLETLRQETHSQGSPVKMVWLKLMSSASVKNYTSKKKWRLIATSNSNLHRYAHGWTSIPMQICKQCLHLHVPYTTHLKKKKEKGMERKNHLRHQDVLK